ncbi:hypothetical protein IWT30_02010 [Secundilactobacillus mixtipabuli]|uniref:Uncharacterized protein n=1 Tax=Secundilactobacillus mixtipabuli TaxID=1435342 RepID=A0A1Z5IF13_9LACO|nr:hypothetical protein IWT30_02010 [Secundilactobacillus mixtipabuli]
MDYSQNIILPKFTQKCNVILQSAFQQFASHLTIQLLKALKMNSVYD